MHPFAAALGALVMTLGGVDVSVTSSASLSNVRPVDPPDTSQAWYTSELNVSTYVHMTDGRRFKVTRTLPNSAGDMVVTLKPNALYSPYVAVTVPADSLDVPIWWTGEPPPPRQDLTGPGTPITPSPEPTPDPTPTPEEPPAGG